MSGTETYPATAVNDNGCKPLNPPRHIAAAIAESGGWLAFDRYMDLALHHPDHGYYGAGRARIGEGGDFDTAAETSALYARALAGQCAEVLKGLGGGDIMELGPGSGRLAEVMLDELGALGMLPQRYLLVEPAPGMRAAQKQRLLARCRQSGVRLKWLDRPPPQCLRGVVLANEVIDALPCKRFRLTGGGWLERGVILKGGRLAWKDRPAGPVLASALDALRSELAGGLPDGYCSEIRPALDGFVGGLARSLQAGMVLAADYGLPRHELYLAERSQGTLGCHYGQRWHDDPFRRPGREDITAWVDFTAVARASQAAGLSTAGYASQVQFLLAAGILELAGSPPSVEDAAALRRLLLPGGMGEAFKFIGLATEGVAAPSGFAGRDRRASLEPAAASGRLAAGKAGE